MTGVIELETRDERPDTDTWIMRVPDHVCDREGFVRGTLVSMTIKNGGIKSKLIKPPAEKFQEISSKLLRKNKDLYERLKQIGD